MKRKPNAPPIEFTCTHCGTKFFAPARLARKTCSRECSTESQKKRENRSCVICGTEYITRPSSKVRVCSHVCKNKLNAISNTDESTHTTSICPECKKTFTYHTCWPRKYCCKACAAKNAVTNFKDFVPSAFIATCENCGKKFKTTPKATRGRFCSLACYGKWLKANAPTGEKSRNWRGGYEPYYGSSWTRAREAARDRDKHKCVDCGITSHELGRELDVHHLLPFRTFGRDRHIEANSLDNLVSLCNECHTKREWTSGNRQQSFESE